MVKKLHGLTDLEDEDKFFYFEEHGLELEIAPYYYVPHLVFFSLIIPHTSNIP